VPSPADLTVVFETHASSLDNEAGLASGWFDVGLSASGERQAQSLGERRRGGDIAVVFTSDLRRAVRTAEIAFGGRGLPIVRDPRLRECDYGSLTRRPATEVEAVRPNHVSAPFPSGQSYEQVARRVASWLEDATQAYAGRMVLVIGHRATFYALEHLVNGAPLGDAVLAPWAWQPGWVYRVARS
jgi:broad specificity phosphatase PhoE